MDQEGAHAEANKTTPLFGAYRRGGYDPEQVDHYVADQQRRLEAAEHRASDAERRLAAAVGQLRELHRRVAVLESEDRSPQAPSLDTLGERVQRILQEAWEGAYALRQAAEQEVTELRDRATSEAEEIVKTAEERAQQIDEEIERRRKAYLARLEEDRGRAVAQVSYLHEQRRAALSELMRVKELIEATVGDSPVRVPPPVGHPEALAGLDLAPPPSVGPPADPRADAPARPERGAARRSDEVLAALKADDEHVREPARHEPPSSAPTVRVPTIAAPTAATARPEEDRDVDSHREHLHEETATVSVRSLGALVSETRAEDEATVRRLEDDEQVAGEPSEDAGQDGGSVAGVFDFDEE
ncbi:MAG: hypothetical protein M0004_17085 [Actinomycetota bacterium]|nr:hypothetical protein [Actinomycetota bacterium]